MYVFGGTKVLTEEMTNELWALDLATMAWAVIGTNKTNDSSISFLPIPVRSHTAHVIGSKMVVILGWSSLEDSTVSLVQEFDFSEFIGQLNMTVWCDTPALHCTALSHECIVLLNDASEQWRYYRITLVIFGPN